MVNNKSNLRVPNNLPKPPEKNTVDHLTKATVPTQCQHAPPCALVHCMQHYIPSRSSAPSQYSFTANRKREVGTQNQTRTRPSTHLGLVHNCSQLHQSPHNLHITLLTGDKQRGRTIRLSAQSQRPPHAQKQNRALHMHTLAYPCAQTASTRPA
jgi:hypothetical protein